MPSFAVVDAAGHREVFAIPGSCLRARGGCLEALSAVGDGDGHSSAAAVEDAVENEIVLADVGLGTLSARQFRTLCHVSYEWCAGRQLEFMYAQALLLEDGVVADAVALSSPSVDPQPWAAMTTTAELGRWSVALADAVQWIGVSPIADFAKYSVTRPRRTVPTEETSSTVLEEWALAMKRSERMWLGRAWLAAKYARRDPRAAVSFEGLMDPFDYVDGFLLGAAVYAATEAKAKADKLLTEHEAARLLSQAAFMGDVEVLEYFWDARPHQFSRKSWLYFHKVGLGLVTKATQGDEVRVLQWLWDHSLEPHVFRGDDVAKTLGFFTDVSAHRLGPPRSCVDDELVMRAATHGAVEALRWLWTRPTHWLLSEAERTFDPTREAVTACVAVTASAAATGPCLVLSRKVWSEIAWRQAVLYGRVPVMRWLARLQWSDRLDAVVGLLDGPSGPPGPREGFVVADPDEAFRVAGLGSQTIQDAICSRRLDLLECLVELRETHGCESLVYVRPESERKRVIMDAILEEEPALKELVARLVPRPSS